MQYVLGLWACVSNTTPRTTEMKCFSTWTFYKSCPERSQRIAIVGTPTTWAAAGRPISVLWFHASRTPIYRLIILSFFLYRNASWPDSCGLLTNLVNSSRMCMSFHVDGRSAGWFNHDFSFSTILLVNRILTWTPTIEFRLQDGSW